MKVSRRVAGLQPYSLVEMRKRIVEKRAKGEEVINFVIRDDVIHSCLRV